MVKTIKNEKKIRKPTNKGMTIQFLMAQGKTNAEISKILKVPKTTVSYYRKRPLELEAKRKSKLPPEYLNEIIRLASNKTNSQMSGGRIANIINENLKNNNIIDKNNNILSITKRSVNRILKRNKIKESFLNYSTMSGNKNNKSFNFNKKEDPIICKIKNSENLILFFSEKYGNGNFNIFLNEFERNKISKEVVKREINIIEKIIKNNNKNIIKGLNDKAILEKSNKFIKKRKITPYKKDKKNLNLKKKIEQIKKSQKFIGP